MKTNCLELRLGFQLTVEETLLGYVLFMLPFVILFKMCHQPPAKVEKAAIIELRKGIIQITPVKNDSLPRSIVILTGLKTLFQKQLPKMPREYIARLVYDANSKALAIIKRGYKVVGGICFRPFPHRGFAEIVFFATASVDQDKVCGLLPVVL